MGYYYIISYFHYLCVFNHGCVVLGAGKNLQICFMNETASDNESQASDIERNLNHNNRSSSRSSVFSKSSYNHPYQTRPLSVNITKQDKVNTTQNSKYSTNFIRVSCLIHYNL
jgi:hypothetical protein